MATKGELYPLTSTKSDQYSEVQRSTSPVWISKLLGSVWKMESPDCPTGSQPENGGQGQTPPQRLWDGDGFTSPCDDDIGRTVEKLAAQTWRPLSGGHDGLAQYASPHLTSNGARGKFHTHAHATSTGSQEPSWSRDCDVRGTLSSSNPIGLPPSKSRDLLRHHGSGGGVYYGDERDLGVGSSPGMQRLARCSSSSYSSPEPSPFYPARVVKLDGYSSSSFAGFPTSQATLTSGSDAQGHSGFPSQSPFCSSPDDRLYTKTNFHDIDFACHAQAQPSNHQPFSYHHQQKPQSYPSGFPNPSLGSDVNGMDFNKPRDPSLSMEISRPGKGCRGNSTLPYNDPFSGRDALEKSFSTSPHSFDAPYSNGRDLSSRYTGFVQPEHGKPTVSPVFDDATSMRRSKAQAYYPDTHHHPHHDKYPGSSSSPRYQRLSPVSPSVTHNHSSAGGSSSLNQQLSHRSLDAVEFSHTSPNLMYNLPTKPIKNNNFLQDASSNGFSVHHGQRHRRQHSPEGTKKSSKQPRGAQNLPPCRVCGNKASGLHFGVNTCEACNEFFRRSLKRGANYHCSRNLSCKVWGKKRSPCSSCRYRRCLEVGMSRNRIKTGRYSHRTRAEYAQEIERNKRNETYEQERERVLSMLESLVESHDRYIRNSSHIPQEDILRIQEKFLATYKKSKKRRKSRRRKTKDESHADVNTNSSVCKPGPEEQQTTNISDSDKDVANTCTGLEKSSILNVEDILRSSANFSPVQTSDNLELKDNKDHLSLGAETTDKGSVVTKTSDLDTISFTSPSPSSSEMSRPVESGIGTDIRSDHRSDLDIDADHGSDALGDIDQGVVEDGAVNGEDSEATDSDYFSDCMGLTRLDADITERWLRSYITYAKLVPGFKHLPISDQANLVRLSWFEFWYLGAYRGFNSELKVVMYPIGHTLHESQFTSVFGEEFSSWSFHLADRMRNLSLTPEEMVLMKTVCLLAPDRCELKDKEAVEKMYWAMVSALLHVLEKNRPRDRTIFPKIISKMVELRTLSAIAMKAHSGALFPDVFPQRPLLGEMVVSNK